MSNVHDVQFGPYRLVINETNSERGVVPLVNVLRDPRFNHIENCDEYHQVWTGDLIEFYELLEKATRPAWA